MHCKAPPGNAPFLKECCQGIILKQGNKRVFCQNKAIYVLLPSLHFTLASLWFWRCPRPWFKYSDNHSLYFKVTRHLVSIWNMGKLEWHLNLPFCFSCFVCLWVFSPISQQGLRKMEGGLTQLLLISLLFLGFTLLFDLIISLQALFSSHH